MHDIFDAKLLDAAKARGIIRVDATWIEKPSQANRGFTIARSADQAFLKAGVSMLADLELDGRKDNVHHRSSGLDSTTARLCAQHGVLIGVNLANLRTLDPLVLGRVMQNIRLCRKHKTAMAVFSNARDASELPDEGDTQALLRTLGMSTSEAKRALGALERATAKK